MPETELNSDSNFCASSTMSFVDDTLTEVGKPGTNSSFMSIFVDPIGRRLGKNQKYFIN